MVSELFRLKRFLEVFRGFQRFSEVFQSSHSPSQNAIFLPELRVVLPLIVLPLKTPTTTIRAPPPQKPWWTSPVQSWGWCTFCCSLRFWQFVHHPSKFLFSASGQIAEPSKPPKPSWRLPPLNSTPLFRHPEKVTKEATETSEKVAKNENVIELLLPHPEKHV